MLNSFQLPLRALREGQPFYLTDPLCRKPGVTLRVYRAGEPASSRLDPQAEIWVLYATERELAAIQRDEYREMPAAGTGSFLRGLINGLDSDWF